MKKTTISIQLIILLTVFFGNHLSYSHTVTETKKSNEATIFEENILIYGMYFKYSYGKVREYYPTATSLRVRDIPEGLTFDLDTGIMEGIPELQDGMEYQSYDPSLIFDFEDKATEYIALGEYTTLRPSVCTFQIIDTNTGNLVSNTSYRDSTYTLTIDITNSNNFAIIAKDYSIEVAASNLDIEDFTSNGIEADFFINDSFFNKEKIEPYALNGDSRGAFHNISLDEGTYKISVRFYSTELNKYVSDFQPFTLNIIKNPLDQLILHPNPATDIITIDNVSNDGDIHVNIIDIQTSMLLKEAVITPFTNTEITVSELNPGMYLAQFIYKNNIKTVEFIKR